MSAAVKHSEDAGLLINERHVNAVLARVYRKNGHTQVPAAAPMPFDALLAAEGGDERADILAAKEEAVNEFLAWVWSVGPKPEPVFKRLCAITRMTRPELVLGMNRTEMAHYLGDKGRATHTAREHKLQEELRVRGGFKTLTLPDQKSETAREKSRNQARGNRNRCGGTRKQAA